MILFSKTKNVFKIINPLKWSITSYSNQNTLYIKDFEERNKGLRKEINSQKNRKKMSK